MTFKAQIEAHHIDAEDLVTPKVWQGTPRETKNGLMYHALYLLVLSKQNKLTVPDEMRFRKLLKSCEVLPGYYKRGPSEDEIARWDDYVCIDAVARKLGWQDITRAIADRHPVEHDRFPHVPPFYRLCDSQFIKRNGRIMLAGAFYLDAMIGSPNGHVLCWAMKEGISGGSEAIDSAIESWTAKMTKRYGTLGALFDDYFETPNPFCELSEAL